jgi:hypothetical protein
MKEATGELNMTLVVIVAVAAVMAFAVFFVPKILSSMNEAWDAQSSQTIGNHGMGGASGKQKPAPSQT